MHACAFPVLVPALRMRQDVRFAAFECPLLARVRCQRSQWKYCFLVNDTSDKILTVLVIKDSASRAVLARPALCKGHLRDDTVDQAVASIRRLGCHRRILLKTDNEPVLLDSRRSVAERLGVQTAQESPPTYEPQSNGSVGNA
eukprot:11432067-Alexandrium_andersonii.AAC.1